MMITLHENKSQINTLQPWNELDPKGVADPTSDVGAIVIQIGVEGIRSVQIVADHSDEEEALLHRLTAARPALARMHRTIQAFNAEAVDVGG